MTATATTRAAGIRDARVLTWLDHTEPRGFGSARASLGPARNDSPNRLGDVRHDLLAGVQDRALPVHREVGRGFVGSVRMGPTRGDPLDRLHPLGKLLELRAADSLPHALEEVLLLFLDVVPNV